MSREKLIEITYFVNPHLFWFKYADETVNKTVQMIETNLKSYVKRKSSSENEIFRVGHMVAVYIVAEQKWIRGKLIQIESNNEYLIVWATDYGYPIKTTSNLVASINDWQREMLEHESPIICGAIYGIRPYYHSMNVSLILNKKNCRLCRAKSLKFFRIFQAQKRGLVNLNSKEWKVKEATDLVDTIKTMPGIKLYFVTKNFKLNDRVFGEVEYNNSTGRKTFSHHLCQIYCAMVFKSFEQGILISFCLCIFIEYQFQLFFLIFSRCRKNVFT